MYLSLFCLLRSSSCGAGVIIASEVEGVGVFAATRLLERSIELTTSCVIMVGRLRETRVVFDVGKTLLVAL